MNEERRREIEEEERYRLQVRQRADHENRQTSKPSYWLGFWLNVLLVGIGFFVIGQWGWALFWFILTATLGGLTGFIATPFMLIFALIHYRNAYAAKYNRQESY